MYGVAEQDGGRAPVYVMGVYKYIRAYIEASTHIHSYTYTYIISRLLYKLQYVCINIIIHAYIINIHNIQHLNIHS